MKKTYMAPDTLVQNVMPEMLIAASIKTVSGNSGIGMGTGETPTEADVKDDGNFYGESLFD